RAAATVWPLQFKVECGGQSQIQHDAIGTPMEGIYVAGNITGIERARVARAQGKVAALSIINNQGMEKVASKLQSAMEDVNQSRHDASIQFHPNIEYVRKKVAEAFAAATK